MRIIISREHYFKAMQIQSQKILKLNITAVLSEIDYSCVTAERMRNAFELSANEKDSCPFFEPANDVKILLIQGEGKIINLEKNRLLVSDTSRRKLGESELIKYFKQALDNLADQNKITDYGFNYDLLVKMQNKINFKNFISSALLKSLSARSILETGIRVIFDKSKVRYDLQLFPAGRPCSILVHMNAHYASKKINFAELKKQFTKHYLELIQIVKKI